LKEVGNIHLTWRKGAGFPRHIVGVIKRNATDGISFSYNQHLIDAAKKDGFTPYVEFKDIEKNYTENVIEIFGQRLMKQERSDISSFYSFWQIDHKFAGNKYYMLAHTQGLLPIDNFEFLAEYYPIKDLSFVSDLAGLTHSKLDPSHLIAGDELNYIKERNNPYDKYAVKVFKGDTYIGLIKLKHNLVFHRSKSRLKIRVTAVISDAIIRRVFVKISM
jgi:hypothetical protein